MSSPRKRKIGVVTSPHADDVNDLVLKKTNLYKERQAQLTSECKVFNDPVHGHFSLPLICFKIIDTLQFQRLRKIKQLGCCYFVYPGASHNRFEHSIGTAYLAGRMCRSLQKNQPELNITCIDQLCVQIAGLCHDLGHGAFSHFFDGNFIPTVNPDSDWKHEIASINMFDHLIEKNNLMPIFDMLGFTRLDFIFIKEMIAGPLKENIDKKYPYVGRPIEKSYLYQIVSNKQTGVDVDKWDYFARDCHHLGISNNFDYKRYMKFVRVIHCNGKSQICTRDKEVSTLYDMFHTRNSLHRRAYQHKTAKVIECMLCDVFKLANEHIKIPDDEGHFIRISDCINNMSAFTRLTDEVLSLIEISTDPLLMKAKEILYRIYRRELYQMVGQTILSNKNNLEDKSNEKYICDILQHNETVSLNPDDFVVHIVTFDYGMKDKDPLSEARFYDKTNPNVAIKVKKSQVSQMLPETFSERHLRLYCKVNNTDILKDAKIAFESWCKDMAFSVLRNDAQPELTPVKNHSPVSVK